MRQWFVGALVLAATMVSSAHAGLMTYTLSGTGFIGTVDGESFSNGNFTMTGTADTADIQSGSLFYGMPTYYVLTTVTMTITENAVTKTCVLSNTNGHSWMALTADLTNQPGVGFAGFVDAFTYFGALTGAVYGGDPGIYTGLAVAGSWNYTFSFAAGGIVPSSLGDVYLGGIGQSGTWTISGPAGAVPEPTSATLLALAGVGLVIARRRFCQSKPR